LASAFGGKQIPDIARTLKTPQREFWYIYDHGSGNEDATTSYTITTIAITPFVQEVEAQSPAAPLAAARNNCTDPPWLKRQFTNFKISDCSYRDFDSTAIELADGKKVVVAAYFPSNYVLTDMTRSPTALAVKNN